LARAVASDGESFDLHGWRRFQQREGAEDEQRQLGILKDLGVGRVLGFGIHVEEADPETDFGVHRRFC
jgi:hypothetical protein